MNDSEYKAYGCELCPAWLHAKCIFSNASDTNLQILFEFNSSFDVQCQERQQKQRAKLANLVTKDDFNNFTTIIEQKIKALAILPSTTIYPQRLFCCELFVIGQS